MDTNDALNLLVKYNGYSDYVKSIINHINGFQGKPVACPDWLRKLSLIHISEPTRP